MNKKFNLVSDYYPSGDQPKAINELVNGIHMGVQSQMLMGITGSGKTFTMANIIAKINKPTLIMVHNKTLAAQLYFEFKSLFPDNAVEYFVSYYDYYQPEAYIPKTDVYIEKDVLINEQIDLLRHSATRSLLERKDVIVVSSVSCIYGIGSPDLYHKMTVELNCGLSYERDKLFASLVSLQYNRNDNAFERGTFRVRGDIIDVFPSHYSDKAWRLCFFGNVLEEIYEIDSLTNSKIHALERAILYANSHFVTPKYIIEKALIDISNELNDQLLYFEKKNQLLEKQRLKQRTLFDIEMLMETGHCKGIENYSRFFTNRSINSYPPTLFEYLPKDSLLFVDESHVTIPQLRAMYNGDQARKKILVEHGFRLPSAMDNRPLTFDEWQKLRPKTIFVSATPGNFEVSESQGIIVEQIIRPTGLLDPICIIKPALNQVEDLIHEMKTTIDKSLRVLVTTLTKKMSEDLTVYLKELNFKVSYLHSDIKTLERVEIINELRKGIIDIIVGINLLREGLDIPECGLVAILDSDKEGFLRSETSLIQTIGRAARNSDGRVILYADQITNSIKKAVSETTRRRAIQEEYNKINNIIPKSINKGISSTLLVQAQDNDIQKQKDITFENEFTDLSDFYKIIKLLKNKMFQYAKDLEFEKAAKIRDKIEYLEKKHLTIAD